jgi:Kef-type K+ transport system membrane component KefB
MFVLWYSVPELIGRLPTRTADILCANIVTAALVLLISGLEWDTERLAYSKPAQGILVALYVLCATLLVAFTFGVPVPWADFFR